MGKARLMIVEDDVDIAMMLMSPTGVQMPLKRPATGCRI
jgi:hypothetical protein